MSTQRKITVFLFALFAFVSSNSIGNSHKQSFEAVKTASISESDTFPLNDESISTIEGLWSVSAKGNEHVPNGFKNSEKSKKYLPTDLAWQSTKSLKAFYSVYLLSRTNSIHASPFYIAFHRLTI